MAKVKALQSESNALPPDVELALQCEFGSQINRYIAGLFGMSAGQLLDLTRLIGDVYNKRLAVDKLKTVLRSKFSVQPNVAAKIALEICSRRLLVVDDWLEGAVSKTLRDLGRDSRDFIEDVAGYKRAIAVEVAEEKAAEAAQQALENPEPVRDLAEEQRQTMEDVMKDPEAEKKASLEVFAKNVKDLLESPDWSLRMEVNARLIALLVDDAETKFFQKELLEELYNNKELLTTEKITLKNEKVDPTIGHWLQDYVMFVGVEGVVNSLKKAQYQADSDNMKKLPPAERTLVDRLFNLYSAVKNFYINVEKMDLADIEIFPFTEQEKRVFVQAEISRQATAVKPILPVESEPVDIPALYRGREADRAAIDREKAKLNAVTRGEYNKVADELERQLLARQKFAIIAGLEILAENGALDDVLANDARYRSYLNGYFKRNNLATEAAEFAKRPHDAKFLKYFLRFIFLERLGMAENEGARLAANLSNIFLANGLFEYGELAYLDLNDRTFKWE